MSDPQVSPSTYWRASQKWSQFLGRQGTVVASTVIRVSSEAFSQQVPYAYVVVDFGNEKAELMGAEDLYFKPGEKIYCVLRKLAKTKPDDVVSYGIKVIKEQFA